MPRRTLYYSINMVKDKAELARYFQGHSILLQTRHRADKLLLFISENFRKIAATSFAEKIREKL